MVYNNLGLFINLTFLLGLEYVCTFWVDFCNKNVWHRKLPATMPFWEAIPNNAQNPSFIFMQS